MTLKTTETQKAAHESIEELMHAWVKAGTAERSQKAKRVAQKQTIAGDSRAENTSRGGHKSRRSPEPHETIGRAKEAAHPDERKAKAAKTNA